LRYNLELRAALYWCDYMAVQIYDNFKDFWHFLKLFKLMFWATPQVGNYAIALDGPISPLSRRPHAMDGSLRPFAGPALGRTLVDGGLGASAAPSAAPLPAGPHRRWSATSNAAVNSTARLEADFAAEFHAPSGGDERDAWQLARRRGAPAGRYSHDSILPLPTSTMAAVRWSNWSASGIPTIWRAR
jgi:hypothetical protein